MWTEFKKKSQQNVGVSTKKEEDEKKYNQYYVNGRWYSFGIVHFICGWQKESWYKLKVAINERFMHCGRISLCRWTRTE